MASKAKAKEAESVGVVDSDSIREAAAAGRLSSFMEQQIVEPAKPAVQLNVPYEQTPTGIIFALLMRHYGDRSGDFNLTAAETIHTQHKEALRHEQDRKELYEKTQAEVDARRRANLANQKAGDLVDEV